LLSWHISEARDLAWAGHATIPKTWAVFNRWKGIATEYYSHVSFPVLMPRKASASRAEPAIDAPDRRRLPLLLRRAWYGLNQAFRRRIAHLELTPDQFTVMRTLLENEGITQRRLTELMSSDPNTVASLIERMERAGLIERQTHERDRRANCLRLGPAGKSKYRAARDVAVALQTEVLSALPARAREPFLAHLDAMAEACRTAAARSVTND
jgi:DNA-binding MarR family transcriptional regulator